MVINEYNEAVEALSDTIFGRAMGVHLGSGGSIPAAKIHELATRAVCAARILVDVQIGMGVFYGVEKDDKQTEGNARDSEVHAAGGRIQATGASDTKGNSGVVRKPSGRAGKTS